MCTQSNHRKRLYNAGKLLQDLFYETRAVCFDLPIGRVEEINGQLRIYERPTGPHEAFLVPFASEHFRSIEDKQAMLAVASCSDALWKMHKIVLEALEGIVKGAKCQIGKCTEHPKIGSYKNICEAAFTPARKHCAIFIQLDGKTPLWTQERHEVFKISLKDGNTYSLDLAGAQYGYHRPVTPWNSYLQVMGASEVSEEPLGSTAQLIGTEAKYAVKKAVKDTGEVILSQSNASSLAQHWLSAYFNSEVTSWAANNKTLRQILQSATPAFDRECTAFVRDIAEELRKFGKWMTEGHGKGFKELLSRNGRMTRFGRDRKAYDNETLKIFEKLRKSDACVDGVSTASLPDDYTSFEDIVEQIRSHRLG